MSLVHYNTSSKVWKNEKQTVVINVWNFIMKDLKARLIMLHNLQHQTNLKYDACEVKENEHQIMIQKWSGKVLRHKVI